jgi:hypothetical protein
VRGYQGREDFGASGVAGQGVKAALRFPAWLLGFRQKAGCVAFLPRPIFNLGAFVVVRPRFNVGLATFI